MHPKHVYIKKSHDLLENYFLQAEEGLYLHRTIKQWTEMLVVNLNQEDKFSFHQTHTFTK